jgi:hypothetical protein
MHFSKKRNEKIKKGKLSVNQQEFEITELTMEKVEHEFV